MSELEGKPETPVVVVPGQKAASVTTNAAILTSVLVTVAIGAANALAYALPGAAAALSAALPPWVAPMAIPAALAAQTALLALAKKYQKKAVNEALAMPAEDMVQDESGKFYRKQ